MCNVRLIWGVMDREEEVKNRVNVWEQVPMLWSFNTKADGIMQDDLFLSPVCQDSLTAVQPECVCGFDAWDHSYVGSPRHTGACVCEGERGNQLWSYLVVSKVLSLEEEKEQVWLPWWPQFSPFSFYLTHALFPLLPFLSISLLYLCFRPFPPSSPPSFPWRPASLILPLSQLPLSCKPIPLPALLIENNSF